MANLFTEVTSPKSVDTAEAEKLKAAAAESSESLSAESDSAQEKGKHGDPGVCCGGCS